MNLARSMSPGVQRESANLAILAILFACHLSATACSADQAGPALRDPQSATQPAGDWVAEVFGQRVQPSDLAVATETLEKMRAAGFEIDLEEERVSRLAAKIAKLCKEHLVEKYQLRATREEIATWSLRTVQWMGASRDTLADAVPGERALLQFFIDYRQGKVAPEKAVDECFRRMREHSLPASVAEFESGFADREAREEWFNAIVRAFPTAKVAQAQLDRLESSSPEAYWFGQDAEVDVLSKKAMEQVYGARALIPPEEAVTKLVAQRKAAGEAHDRALVVWYLTRSKAREHIGRFMLEALKQGDIVIRDQQLERSWTGYVAKRCSNYQREAAPSSGG